MQDPNTTPAAAPTPKGAAMQVFHEPGKVIIAFNQKVDGVGVSPAMALSIAKDLTKHALLARGK